MGAGSLQHGRPRMSLAADMVDSHPNFPPYQVDVQALLARRAQLDHTLASLVSILNLTYSKVISYIYFTYPQAIYTKKRKKMT